MGWDCGGCKATPKNGLPYCPGQNECAFLEEKGLNKVKRLPCTYCGARGGKRHEPDCFRPRVQKAFPIDKAFALPQQRNKIAIIVDSSSSMNPFRYQVPKVINEQIAEIKKNAAKLGQQTSISIYSFDDSVRREVMLDDVFNYKSEFIYYPHGNTALFDAVGMAIQDFNDTKDLNTSFLIITITDGEENRSKRFDKNSLTALMRQVEKTDRWTFVFSVPFGGRRTLSSFGIPDGNIQEWEQTIQGLETMNTNTVGGIGSYYVMRSAGMTRSSNFFQPDMTAVSKTAVRNLDDLSRDFHVWNVDRNAAIKDFVEDKLAQQPSMRRLMGRDYQIGRGYYQLTKSEEVQASKDMVILDKATNALYGGNQARELIGCPTNIAFKIKPGNHANYEIFIKSTSVNRKLVQGTKMLYYVG